MLHVLSEGGVTGPGKQQESGMQCSTNCHRWLPSGGGESAN